MLEKIKNLVWGALCVACLCACTDKAPEYPDLEGFWKQERIAYEATGTQAACERLFWAFQLGVCEVKNLGEERAIYICRYDYDEGGASLRLYDFRDRGSQEPVVDDKLAQFGIPSGDVTFAVRHLDGDHMVLQVADTTLYFRAF